MSPYSPSLKHRLTDSPVSVFMENRRKAIQFANLSCSIWISQRFLSFLHRPLGLFLRINFVLDVFARFLIKTKQDRAKWGICLCLDWHILIKYIYLFDYFCMASWHRYRYQKCVRDLFWNTRGDLQIGLPDLRNSKSNTLKLKICLSCIQNTY